MKKIAALLFILGFISFGASLAWFMHPLRRSSNPAPGAPAATGITFSPAPQPAPPTP